MGEFFIIFAVTCLILCSLVAAMIFGRPPVYQVSREEALNIMGELLVGNVKEVNWLIFIGHAIPIDPQLNEIRLQCNDVELAAEQGRTIRFSANSKRYDQAGLDQIKRIISELEMLIAQTPVVKEF
jgi:hypothetical protein